MRFKTQKLLIFIITTRIAILVFSWLTITLLFPEESHHSFLAFIQSAWVRWDAPHYLYIAQNWYTNTGDAANFIVFFPLYPLIIKIFAQMNLEIDSIVVSTILFLLGSYYFYKLVCIDYPEKIARWAVISLAIFPTSYFFNAPYTEALFLLIFSVSMYAARREKWIVAGLFAALACVTRPFGILVLPAILTEWLFSKNRQWRLLPIIVLPSIVAITAYLYLNQSVYGDLFAFQKILASHWQKHLMSPFLSILDSWKIAMSGGLTNFGIMVGWMESLTLTISWILIPFAFWKLRKSWAVFYTLSIIMFSSTSFILSTPRYLLSIPPFFVLLALAQKNYLFKIVWGFVSVGLLFCFAILFARGQWAF